MLHLPSLRNSSSFSSLHVYLLIFSFLVMNFQIAQQFTLPKNVKVPAIFGYGDSIIDPGNNNHLPTVVKCNFSPYGRDFIGGKPTGRFCDGKIPTDLIAEALGIKELIPAYLDPSLKPTDLVTGVSFASGGAGYDPLTAKLVTVVGLADQVIMFKGYIEKLKAAVGEERAARIISESVYFVVAGSDDIANTYFTSPFRRFKYDIAAYTDLMAQGASSFLEELYALGARKFGVFSAPPIGCVPSQRTSQGGKQRKCGEKENEAAILFNTKLSSVLKELKTKYQDVKAVYIDIYNPLLDIIMNPHHYGFEVADKGCCGTGKAEVAILCNDLSPMTCQNISNYVFWDSYHPTQKTYKAIVYPLLEKYLKYFV